MSLLMQSDSSLEVIVSSFPQSGGTEALGYATLFSRAEDASKRL